MVGEGQRLREHRVDDRAAGVAERLRADERVAQVVGVEDSAVGQRGARRRGGQGRCCAGGSGERGGHLHLDLDAALAEEAAEAADDALALFRDDGLGAELAEDLRQELLERAATVRAGLLRA